jgi:hypothetical protein
MEHSTDASVVLEEESETMKPWYTVFKPNGETLEAEFGNKTFQKPQSVDSFHGSVIAFG